jgi:hypothetical protein
LVTWRRSAIPLKLDPRDHFGLSVTDAFLDALQSDLDAQEQRRASFLQWAMKVPESKGPLNFARWPFQRELYEQGFDDREVVVMKATQLGMSAWLVRWALCWADMHAARVLYIFPRERQLLDFSDGRIKPLILGEYLRTRVPPASVMNKTLKSVGLGICYFRGSEAEAGLESIDADALCLDEHDLLVQAHIPIAERRVGGQDSLGLIRRVGFPTISEHGIHKEYGKTDQREWMVRCEACGEWQAITWAENVDLERGIRICRVCHHALDVAVGEWVATYPDRAMRGYHVTKLILPSDTIVPKLIEASQEQVAYKRQIFYNRDLGEPWEAEGARLTPAMVAATQRGYLQATAYDGMRPVMMGVDVASVRALNVWVTEQLSDTQNRVLYLGLVDSFDELAKLMDRYRVVMAAIDHLPEGRLARAFANRFAGRVYIVSYSSDQQKDVLSVDDQQRRASVRRTEAIDALQERIRAQREYLPQDLPDDFVRQMCANVRSVEQDDVGRVKVLYRADGPDDWAQAGVYALVAADCWWIRQQVGQEQITSIDEMEQLGFERSTLRDDSMQYSPGPGEGEYTIEQSNGYDGDEVYDYD